MAENNPTRAAATDESPAGAISRAELFTTLYLLAVINAVAGPVLAAVRSTEPLQALADVFNLTTAAATVVGIHLLRQMPQAAVRHSDWLAATFAASLLLVPHRSASWLAVVALALYTIGRDRDCKPAVAAGSVFLLLALSDYWGALLGQALGPVLPALDAALAAALLAGLTGGEVERVGNLIMTADQTLLVMFWCSFLPNLLLGSLWYAVIARAIRPNWRSADLSALLAVGGLVLAANTVRLALMGLSAHTYSWVHGPVGANVFNIGLLLAIAAIALYASTPAADAARRGTACSGEPAR